MRRLLRPAQRRGVCHRQRAIVEHLDAAGGCSYQDLAGLLGVSDMTIRRDVDKLSRRRELIKTLGGAQTAHAPENLYESPIQQRLPVHRPEKEKIAREAMRQIKPQQTIFLDGSTTCLVLARRLAANTWEPSDSTVGAWATQWKLPVSGGKGVEREIWLWDFAGQVDYRLVHQLFMDDTAAAVLVFNPQNENPFEGLGHWDRDLQKAARKPFAKLLAAARIDRGGLVVSAASMKKFMGGTRLPRFAA